MLILLAAPCVLVCWCACCVAIQALLSMRGFMGGLQREEWVQAMGSGNMTPLYDALVQLARNARRRGDAPLDALPVQLALAAHT